MAGTICNDIEEVKHYLQEYGVAVLAGAIAPGDCDKYRTGFQDWLKLFPNEEFPADNQSLIQDYSIAHHPSSWAVRLAVKPIFAHLWRTQNLHSSTEGIAIGRPPESGETNFDDDVPASSNFHIDQSCKKEGLHAYQGALYLEEASEDDWCFQVMAGSHKHHKTFFCRHRSNDKNEFRLLDQREQKWYLDKGCEIKRIAVPKGGMVIWDSRTARAEALPRKTRKTQDRWRFVVFVSMTPAIWSKPKDVQNKREGYRELRVSRHWSSQGFELFKHQLVKTPQDIQELPEIAKTNEARLLVADLEYDFSDGQSNGPRRIPVIKA